MYMYVCICFCVTVCEHHSIYYIYIYMLRIMEELVPLMYVVNDSVTCADGQPTAAWL